MKRGILLTLAFALTVTTAQAGGWRGQDGRYTFGDVMCGLVGGLAVGKISQLLFKSDPWAVILGLLGGKVAADYCQDLRDEERQAIRNLIDEAGRAQLGQWIPIKTAHYHGYVGAIAVGTSGESDCRQFKFSLYRNETNEYLGWSFVWACEDRGEWIVTNERWIKKGARQNYGSRPSRSGYGSGGGYSQVGGGYSSVESGYSQSVSIESSVVLNWDIRGVSRMVRDGGRERPVQLMNRKGEIGFLKGVSKEEESKDKKDRKDEPKSETAVVMYINGNDPQAIGEPTVSIDEVGIECGVTQFCQTMKVVTADGKEGRMMFLFRNGEVGIMTGQYGYIIRPVSTLRLAD